jgi:uncharacterized protein (TIGR03118 family)
MLPSAALLLSLHLPASAQSTYTQHNLVSDVPGTADHTDPNLVNPWGLDRSGTGPWWINANGTGLSLVYDGTGAAAPAASPIVVTVPPADNGSPSGIIFNSSLDFQIVNARQSLFIFVSENGIVSGWNNQFNSSNAAVKVAADAVFKGAAMGQLATQNMLYVANFRNGSVDMFDANFVSPYKPSGAFQDSQIPAGFAPFNIQNINRMLYVTYAKQDDHFHDDVAGPGNGYVDVFMPDGTLVSHLQHGDWMNSPWAVVLAPSNFGSLSGKLLVGNFGSGQIAAFDPTTGAFQGMMNGPNGKPITIDGLWGLKFGNGGSAGAANLLYFTAGTNHENDGLFGTLAPAQ